MYKKSRLLPTLKKPTSENNYLPLHQHVHAFLLATFLAAGFLATGFFTAVFFITMIYNKKIKTYLLYALVV